MARFSLLISLTVTEIVAILLVLYATPSNSYQPKIETLCVNAVDAPTGCSALTQRFNCSACQPLSFYVQSASKYLTSNVEMVFTKGSHCLPPSPHGAPVVNLTRVSNFKMKGLGRISYNSSEEGAIQPSSVITCSCSQNKSAILFYRSNTIHIENLTIEECGRKVKLTNSAKGKFITVSALMFYQSYDIELLRIRMNRNLEFGLFAEQVYGKFIISNSAFLRCVVQPINKKVNLGSNAYIYYKNYRHEQTSLLIEYSWFLYGGNHSDRAGGLSIFFVRPKVSVLISHIKAMHNIGGNLAIHFSDYHENTSSVTINNSIIAHGSAKQGGGLNIRVEATQLWQHGIVNTRPSTSLSVLAVMNTTFENNSASDRGGGVFIIQYERSITDIIRRNISFKGCQFIGNSIIPDRSLGDGAAVHIYKRAIPDIALHINPLFSFIFTNCTFEYNQLNRESKEGGIVTFILTNSIIIEDSNFTSNEGTAIFLHNSNMQFRGKILFENNSALHGGALSLCQSSKMYLPVGNIHIDFINNSATSTGGAINIREQCTEIIPPCFFQPGYQKHVKFSELNATLLFKDNVAKLAGDVLYGGQIDRCFMVTNDYNSIFKNIMHHSTKAFNIIFNLAQQNNITQSTISSSPFGACFCNTSGSDDFIHTLNCSNMTYAKPVIPGQTIIIGVAAVGQRNGTVPMSSVYFEFGNIKYRSENTTQLVINNTLQVNRPRTRCNFLNCILYSNRKRAVFELILQQATPIEISYVNYESSYLTIFIKECPWGFTLSNSPPYKCECDGLLKNFSIPCTIDTQTVTIPGGHYYWLGCSKSNGSNCRGLSLADNCLLGYCRPETTTIKPETLDHQCSDGREGVLCGRCKSNHSLALGTSRCLPNCPGYLFYILLIVFAASGVLLILFLITCNFTVSEGTINGLFFYAHVVHRNSNSFFPGSTGNSNVFRLFIAWLNLDVGFEICFYRSMTQYDKAWIQCGFLFYLCILELAIIILSRKYIFFTRLFGRNVVKVLATLFLLCSAKMMDIGIGTLEFARIKHSDSPDTIVWLFDGNIRYYTGKHIFLFILGLLFCSFSIVYCMTLLFIQCLQRRSNICCLCWVDRWRPFFEAYTSPCHVNYRFWPGFLFFTRLILSTFGSVLRTKPTINLHIATAACVVILIFAFVSPTGVYKRWPLNVLEFSFFINLGILSTLVATFCHSSGPHASSFVIPSVAIAMFLFACIVLYHCMKRLMSYNRFQRFIQSVAARKENLRGLKWFQVWKEVENEEEAEPFLNEQIPHNFSRYRETLLGDT